MTRLSFTTLTGKLGLYLLLFSLALNSKFRLFVALFGLFLILWFLRQVDELSK